jgi:hypothetical protein
MSLPRRLRRNLLTLALFSASVAHAPLAAQSLRGSSSSLDVQNRIAQEHDFTYLRSPDQVRRFVSAGYLIPVRANADFELHAVSFPFARPEVELFVRRLSRQYRSACGEKLVVTSLTRPLSRQPANASDRSVHPTGMAIDLRRSNRRDCREWVEGVLLSLERAGVLEATRERYPPHYHIALFPQQYERYVSRLASADAASAPTRTPAEPRRAAPVQARNASASTASSSSAAEYQVRRGDSLWTIARRLGITVDDLRTSNRLDSSRIHPGQVLKVPAASQGR